VLPLIRIGNVKWNAGILLISILKKYRKEVKVTGIVFPDRSAVARSILFPRPPAWAKCVLQTKLPCMAENQYWTSVSKSAILYLPAASAAFVL
jgi:hypothetical protein